MGVGEGKELSNAHWITVEARNLTIQSMPDAEPTHFLQTVQRAQDIRRSWHCIHPWHLQTNRSSYTACHRLGAWWQSSPPFLLPATNLAGSRLTKISIFIVPEQPVQIQEEYTTCWDFEHFNYDPIASIGHAASFLVGERKPHMRSMCPCGGSEDYKKTRIQWSVWTIDGPCIKGQKNHLPFPGRIVTTVGEIYTTRVFFPYIQIYYQLLLYTQGSYYQLLHSFACKKITISYSPACRKLTVGGRNLQRI